MESPPVTCSWMFPEWQEDLRHGIGLSEKRQRSIRSVVAVLLWSTYD